MDVDLLRWALLSSDPIDRADAALVIGLVQETELVTLLITQYQEETVPAVKKTMGWAGTRLYKARATAYTTRKAISKHFKIDNAILSGHYNQVDAIRIAPIPPATVSIDMQLDLLEKNTDPIHRLAVAFELRNLNNPDALVPLAKAYLREQANNTRKMIEESGKVIYWNAIYWYMAQNNQIDDFILDRLAEQSRKETDRLRDYGDLSKMATRELNLDELMRLYDLDDLK